MVVHEFIRARKEAWAQLQAFLEKARRLSLAQVPLDVFREGRRFTGRRSPIWPTRGCAIPIIRSSKSSSNWLATRTASCIRRGGQSQRAGRSSGERRGRYVSARQRADSIGDGNLLGQCDPGILSVRSESRARELFHQSYDAKGHRIKAAVDRIAHENFAGGQQRDRGQQH